MHGSSDEMSFEEFKDLMATVSGTSGAMKKFRDLLDSGCSESDAKLWLVEHISEFPENVQRGIMEAVTEDIVRQVEESPLTDEQIKRGCTEIWRRHGFEAAMQWLKQQQRRRRRGNL